MTAETTTPADPAIPTTGTWRIDPVHSTARFGVTHHVVATFRAGFREIAGALTDGVLTGSVKVDSIDLRGPEFFKQQLMGPDWFDVANHTELSFRSTALHAHGSAVQGGGELTMRGVTEPVKLSGRFMGPVEISQGEKTSERIGLDLKATVDRRAFGITGEGGADWPVTLEVALELVRAA